MLIDGVDVRDLRLRDLRRAIGIVFEETFLFSDTIAANISFADPDATAEAIERAARLAGAHDFIIRLDDGYDTLIGERGYSLSGGQRQRIAIARAILADPRVLILDDATSSVDPTKEHEIRDALDRGDARPDDDRHRAPSRDHRPRRSRGAPRRMAAWSLEGTHDELLASDQRYRTVLAAAAHAEAERADRDADAEMADVLADVDAGTASATKTGWAARRSSTSCSARCRCSARQRRQMALAGVLVIAWTGTVLAGPFFVRTGIDQGIKGGDAAVLNRAVVGYIVAAIVGYFVLPRADRRSSAASARSSCATFASRVFDHLQRLSMPFYDREKAGVIVQPDDLRRRLARRARADGPVHVRGATRCCSSCRCACSPRCRGKLLLVCAIALPPVVLASIKFQRDSNVAYLDVRDRIGSTLSQPARGHRRRPGRAGVRP